MNNRLPSFCILASIVVICYMYITTVGGYFQLGIDYLNISSKRNIVLAVIIILSITSAISSKINQLSNVAIYGGLLTFYMMLAGITANIQLLPWFSCIALWYIVFLAFSLVKIDEYISKIIYIICSVTSIILSLLYCIGATKDNIESTVAGSNSIYYVLAVLPLALLASHNYLRYGVLLCCAVAIFISGKGTCILAFICILIYLFISGRERSIKIRGKRNFIFIFISALSCVIITKYTSINIFDTIDGVLNEIADGGNGRTRIWTLCLSNYLENPYLSMLIGCGFNAINARLNIGAHNDFLMVLYNYGILGFSLYILFIIGLIKNIKRIKKNQALHKAYACSIIIFIFMSFASNVINSQIQLLLISSFWGIAIKETT